MQDRTCNVLFICTGNSARSILAEAIIDHWSKGRFKGYSAGSFPKGEVNPVALNLLKRLGMPTAHLRSKSWAEFAEPGAPAWISYSLSATRSVPVAVCSRTLSPRSHRAFGKPVALAPFINLPGESGERFTRRRCGRESHRPRPRSCGVGAGSPFPELFGSD